MTARSGGGIGRADWRRFEAVKARAVDRHCQRALDDAATLAARPRAAHDDPEAADADAAARFEELDRLVRERQREIAPALDGHSRSRAWLQLAHLARLGLLEEEDVAGFSAELREVIARARAASSA